MESRAVHERQRDSLRFILKSRGRQLLCEVRKNTSRCEFQKLKNRHFTRHLLVQAMGNVCYSSRQFHIARVRVDQGVLICTGIDLSHGGARGGARVSCGGATATPMDLRPVQSFKSMI